MTSPRLEEFAAALEGTFPARTDAPLAIALLRLLAEGAPVPVERLAETVRRAPHAVEDRLAGWSNLERDAAGRVVAFAGLSLAPTPHKFMVDGVLLHTWCAWDTLFLPELLGRTAVVESACAVTGTPVALTVAPTGVLDLTPADAHVSIVLPASTGDIRATFCCHVVFLASMEVAESWSVNHPGTTTLTVNEAHELGLRTNAALLNRPLDQAG